MNLNQYSEASAQPGISVSKILNLEIPRPSINEQTIIARYLDCKTVEIDTLIHAKERLVHKLAAQRAAIVNEAVTKGLDTATPMKNSGIEWLGKIPEHWEVKKLKYVGKSIIGLTYTPDDITDEGNGVLVLRSSNIQDDKLAFQDCVYVSSKIPEHLRTRAGDILICARNGSAHLVGKNVLLSEENAGLTWGAFMSVFRAADYKFLYWFLNSPVFKSQTGSFSTSTINQLTAEILNNIEIAIPPATVEQEAISQNLFQKTAQFNALKQKLQTQIAKLRAYRQSLITEVITGKRRVTEAIPESA